MYENGWISKMIPFYCSKSVLSDSVFIVSKTVYLITVADL